jgi:hypothetical protein
MDIRCSWEEKLGYVFLFRLLVGIEQIQVEISCCHATVRYLSTVVLKT